MGLFIDVRWLSLKVVEGLNNIGELFNQYLVSLKLATLHMLSTILLVIICCVHLVTYLRHKAE
jgi:hypothetical protein